MKKYMKILLICILPCLLINCKSKRDFPKVIELKTLKKTIFVPTLEHKIEKNKNSIYSPTILFAWNEIKLKFDKNITIKKSDKDLTLVNNSSSFIDVLNPNEYSTEIEVLDSSIIAKAKFFMSLPFQNKLIAYDDKLIFKNTKVKSFGAYGSDKNSKTIEILYYKNDNEFALKLNAKESDNEIILYINDKDFISMNKILKSLNSKIKIGEKEIQTENNNWKYQFKSNDFVIIPKLEFNLKTNYTNIEGNQFLGNNIKYKISTFWQQNAFILDENGTKVESKAEILVKTTEAVTSVKPKVKNLIFNKPFFIILRKKGKINPYFAIWIENDELMIID